MPVVHIFGIGLIVGIGVTSFFLLRYPHRGLKSILTVQDLGRLEGSLEGLREVIVLADHVERPKDQLLDAVEKNFERGVKYSFIVSQSKGPAELHSYFTMFETLARIVSERGGSRTPVDRLVSIRQLPYDWVDEPHVFYKVPDRTRPNEMRYVAVQGNQKEEGIADFYRLVEPAHAHWIGRGIMTDAPGAITVSREEVAESNIVDNVRDFDTTRARRSN